MHAILGGQERWAGVSGFATEGDFVEVPSQLLEEFFRNAKLLAGFARHYETDEPIPAELVASMNRASAFGRGNGVRGQLFYTRFSLDLHNIDPATIDLDATCTPAIRQRSPIPGSTATGSIRASRTWLDTRRTTTPTYSTR